jgi:hypothetical protein
MDGDERVADRARAVVARDQEERALLGDPVGVLLLALRPGRGVVVDGLARRARAVMVLQRQPERLELVEDLGAAALDLNGC